MDFDTGAPPVVSWFMINASLFSKLSKSFLFLKIHIVIFAGLILLTNSTLAGVFKITGISGTSNYALGDGSSPVVYGGVVGALVNGCAAPSSDSTCNNCLLGDPSACNEERIHPDLYLNITFEVIGEITDPSKLHVGYIPEGGGNTFELTYSSEWTFSGDPNSIVKGTTGTVSILWSTICNEVAFAADCDPNTGGFYGPFTLILQFGLEKDNVPFPTDRFINTSVTIIDNEGAADIDQIDCTAGGPGICEFVAAPGDGKVYIKDLLPFGTCTNDYIAARVFYSPDSFADASYGGFHQDIALKEGCVPSEDGIISGLDNYLPLFFRISILDIAKNNIYLIADPGCAAGSPPTATDDLNCNYIATPGVVNGLLPEDLNCFIATAAYGTPFATKIATLRAFRDQFLKPFRFGRKFINFYYKYGPTAAKYISGKDTLRAVTRAVILPVWGFAWLSLHYGVLGALFFVITFIVLTIFGVRERRWGDL